MTPNRAGQIDKNRLYLDGNDLNSNEEARKSDGLPVKSAPISIFSQSEEMSSRSNVTSVHALSNQGTVQSKRIQKKRSLSPKKVSKGNSILKAAIFFNISEKNEKISQELMSKPFFRMRHERSHSESIPRGIGDSDYTLDEDETSIGSTCAEEEIGDEGEEGCKVQTTFVKSDAWKIHKTGVKK